MGPGWWGQGWEATGPEGKRARNQRPKAKEITTEPWKGRGWGGQGPGPRAKAVKDPRPKAKEIQGVTAMGRGGWAHKERQNNH